MPPPLPVLVPPHKRSPPRAPSRRPVPPRPQLQGQQGQERLQQLPPVVLQQQLRAPGQQPRHLGPGPALRQLARLPAPAQGRWQ